MLSFVSMVLKFERRSQREFPGLYKLFKESLRFESEDVRSAEGVVLRTVKIIFMYSIRIVLY